MAEKKRQATTKEHDAKKRKPKYRSDGTPIWGKRYIDGPGIWVSCVKGKEKFAVAECYDLFESVASGLWPTKDRSSTGDQDTDSSDSGDEDVPIEKQIAKELSVLKHSKTEPRFVNCQTNTSCVVFISCKPPVDPVKLVVELVKDVQATGVVRARCIHRLVPVSRSCGANLNEIRELCWAVFQPFFSAHSGKTFRYKVELRMRNHTVLVRSALIEYIVQQIPNGHTVDLTDPEVFILVEVFKSVCGISIVEDYYALRKFNLFQMASAKNDDDAAATRKVFSSEVTGD